MNDILVSAIGGTIGAEVTLIDVSKLHSDKTIEKIQSTLQAYHVLFLNVSQEFTPEQHIAFGSKFGELETKYPSFVTKLNGYEEIVVLDGSLPNGRATIWHTDVSVSFTPPMGAIMYVKELPMNGGDTMWSDSCSAYDSLSTAMQSFLDGLTAVHDMYSDEYLYLHGIDFRRVRDHNSTKVSRAEHPVVRVLPESGKKCLFVNPLFTSHIVGMHNEESKLLLTYLFNHMTKPEFVCRRSWSPGDIAIWDNRCTMHAAVNDYGDSARIVHRVAIKGEKSVGVSACYSNSTP
jgi:taurine dioxygenase